MRLRDKVALITGGRRVGSDLARHLGRLGCHVAMTYHTSQDQIQQTLTEVEHFGVRTLAVKADLSVPEQVDEAISLVAKTLGKLDVLVNMASIYKKTPITELKADDFSKMIDANLAPAYHCSLAAAKQMKLQKVENGLQGKIISVGDWATERPYKDYLPYLVAKGGLTTLTMALAKELAPTITVNLVQPAMIDPPAEFTEDDRQAVIAITPLKRLGMPDDLNLMILHLLENTDFATGSCYRVDGGRFLGTGE